MVYEEMITTTSNPSPPKTYIRIGWKLETMIIKGSSPYNRVNLRKKGLKPIKCKKFKKMLKHSKTNQWMEIIDLRVGNYDPHKDMFNFEWWDDFYEVIDKKKFFLARVQLGF